MGRRDPQRARLTFTSVATSIRRDEEKLFISEYIGPGFYGVKYAPFMIPDPAQRTCDTLNAVAGMKIDRLDRRQELLAAISGLSRTGACSSPQSTGLPEGRWTTRAR